ncbi:MAG TPA: hypothetical protein VG898_04710 [Solirubrobacterales bacterium]|nr:hypothetical protein [Solirubrobacterales bacterium]
MSARRLKAQLLEGLGRPRDAGAAEGAKELLGAVTDEEQADDEAKYEQGKVHGSSSWSLRRCGGRTVDSLFCRPRIA